MSETVKHPEPCLRAAHLQLTVRCNLACRFCGQRKGALDSEGRELPLERWLEITGDIRRSCAPRGIRPEFTFWGGEPLLAPCFDKLSGALADAGDELRIVTNGTLIDRHATRLCRDFDRINVSFDGFGASDDFIRGDGVFAKAAANLELLAERRGKLSFLLTAGDHILGELGEVVERLAALGPDEIVVQPLIVLSPAEIEGYRKYSKIYFGCDATEVDAYRREDAGSFARVWERAVAKIDCAAVPVRVTRHGGGAVCPQPWRRVHVRFDGEVGFCTDYFGFSLGNVRDAGVNDLFHNDRAELFRRAISEGDPAICRHCAWRRQEVEML